MFSSFLFIFIIFVIFVIFIICLLCHFSFCFVIFCHFHQVLSFFFFVFFKIVVIFRIFSSAYTAKFFTVSDESWECHGSQSSLCHQDEEDDEFGNNFHPIFGSILEP